MHFSRTDNKTRLSLRFTRPNGSLHSSASASFLRSSVSKVPALQLMRVILIAWFTPTRPFDCHWFRESRRRRRYEFKPDKLIQSAHEKGVQALSKRKKKSAVARGICRFCGMILTKSEGKSTGAGFVLSSLRRNKRHPNGPSSKALRNGGPGVSRCRRRYFGGTSA
jgi:hypothetical protein